MLPALLVGVVDGVARSQHRSRWVPPLRTVAFSLVTMLALGIALVAWFFVALTESNLDASIGPLPLGTYLGEPGLRTAEDRIATCEGDAKVAYLKDPDGHTLSIAQLPRS